MAKIESNTDVITRRAPRWAWDTVDDTLDALKTSLPADSQRREEIVNALDVLVTVDTEVLVDEAESIFDVPNEAGDESRLPADLTAEAGKREYTLAHVENAVMLMEHMTERIIDDAKHIKADQNIQWLADIGGSAELRAHVIAIAKELEDQFLAIGLKWDVDCGFYDLTERIATAIVMHPKTEPAQLVRDVLNAELKVVFRP